MIEWHLKKHIAKKLHFIIEIILSFEIRKVPRCLSYFLSLFSYVSSAYRICYHCSMSLGSLRRNTCRWSEFATWNKCWTFSKRCNTWIITYNCYNCFWDSTIGDFVNWWSTMGSNTFTNGSESVIITMKMRSDISIWGPWKIFRALQYL